MNDRKMLTAKEVGLRIKERRNELKISMPELGRRVGVNKSTIQRYETDGVNPTRSMVINGIAEALLTTPEWLTGLSEEKEYSVPTLCENELTEHIRKYLDTVTSAVKGDGHQQLMTTFLGKLIDLYTILTCHFADAMAEVDRVAEDEGLKQSLRRYAIESGAITERVYRKEMKKIPWHLDKKICRLKPTGGSDTITLRTPYVTGPIATDRKENFYLWQKVL